MAADVKEQYLTIWSFHHPNVKNKTFAFHLQICVTDLIDRARFCLILNGSHRVLYQDTIGKCLSVIEILPKEVLQNWERRTCVWPSDLIQWFQDNLRKLYNAMNDAYYERHRAWDRIKSQQRKTQCVVTCPVPKCYNPILLPGQYVCYHGSPDEDGIKQVQWYKLTTREQLLKDLPGVEVWCSSDFDWNPDLKRHDDSDDDEDIDGW